MAEIRSQKITAGDRKAYLVPWFQLKHTQGVGLVWFRRLVEHFGGPEKVLGAGEKQIIEAGFPPRIAKSVAKSRLSGPAKEELDSAAKNPRFSVTTQHDPDYPPLLRHIADPPPYLYVYGELAPTEKCVAVVGSRNATRYGLSATRRICKDLARAGVVVVSGMARGIDTAAHEGALAGGGKTWAVFGCGLETIYPPENKGLYHEIVDKGGAVVSEFALAEPPKASNFPVRNRVISGICKATVVVEATAKSGSLITAGQALEQGRELFAVPGSINSFKSAGTHALLKQGAALADSARDILDFLAASFTDMERLPLEKKEPPPAGEITQDEAAVLEVLGPYPVHIDILARRLAMDAGKLAGLLLTLELKGLVVQEPGKLFSRGRLI
ncbi:MAG: DNA-protecting protein DprA [Deltaproteobacteria bacterium]|nr:DNA-protecting protein DprA [Deltaproteobacteria bacterium]